MKLLIIILIKKSLCWHSNLKAIQLPIQYQRNPVLGHPWEINLVNHLCGQMYWYIFMFVVIVVAVMLLTCATELRTRVSKPFYQLVIHFHGLW